ncbi:MAG: peptidase domain-containing ABC transporter [Gloeomargaritaceae cyanobacterium C42_A2020_066]|nr:peptidase domain-containing ABC transporter [Gloeomargaritaceae cyanobacterium C42_A2020_066]
MTLPQAEIQAFLAGRPGFKDCSPTTLASVAQQLQPLRYRMGQALLRREQLPSQIVMLYQGQMRLLGYDPQTRQLVTLGRLEPGAVLGWVSLVRGVPCETLIASEESVGLVMPAADFLGLVRQEPALGRYFGQQTALAEVYDLLGQHLANQPQVQNLRELALQIWPQVQVRTLPAGRRTLEHLDNTYDWWVSGGQWGTAGPGTRLADLHAGQTADGPLGLRLVGIPHTALAPVTPEGVLDPTEVEPAGLDLAAIPYAPEPTDTAPEASPSRTYPLVRARGDREGALACFQMLSQWFNLPFRRDVVQRVVNQQLERGGTLNLGTAGAIVELMGLTAQLATLPGEALLKVPTPALITWQDQLVVLYSVSAREVVLGVPSQGLLRRKPSQFLSTWGESGQVLLLQATDTTPQKRFGWSWFLPALSKHRRVLLEVFIASFFVQLFGLANPLMIQVIIDKVLGQKSVDTLHVLGILLIGIAIFEAILGAIRTYLFVDTTNRIDLALGSQIIDHLLRLPLSYYAKRPVGELATRVNELENIRQFLTGTALTVVLDAVFSIIYIVVMVVYSWVLTLVALATVPLFALLGFLAAPLIRHQLRVKAERNAETQSYFTEVLTGIQTVKAQNIELRARWRWQAAYARYVSAGFKTVLTSTTAGSMSKFLQELSGLLLIWVGAYLVLNNQMTLGQLIAFRIIAGYTTSPLLRLVQLWQNFQETALSLERLADILDTPQEAEEEDRTNIPMPAIRGAVKFENVSFRFAPGRPLQLVNISLDFPAGVFVGIVGQSGAGKSTLMKLLPRLYTPEAGRILVDGYDIAKVELYSLRRQIGMVLQEPLLFDGTVQDNIAQANPDASIEEVINAAQVACAHDFIMELALGYNTRVGERGSALSGGQRQRIALARTVLQNPRILVLDEATSALDYNTERQVSLNLSESFQGRTVFFITHRLSTVRHADIILVMDQGAVVEQGTHGDLMAARGRYYALYMQQEAQV